MSANKARAASAGNADGEMRSNGTDDTTLIAARAFDSLFRAARIGCPAGCQGAHECGVGEPLPDLPSPGVLERGGRDLTMHQRDTIGLRWLERRWVA